MKATVEEITLKVSKEEYILILTALCDKSVEQPAYIALNELINDMKKVRDYPLGMEY